MIYKILVNASTLVVGGGIQIGVSFIEEALKRKDYEFIFLISPGIHKNLDCTLREDKRIYCITVSPAKLIKGYKSRKTIKKIEQNFCPDIVYSIGFPSYIKFNSIEIGRYTNPWEINLTPLPWHVIHSKVQRVKLYLHTVYLQFWAKKADFIETQTDLAKNGIAKRIGYKREFIKVIPNSANKLFINEGINLDNRNDLFETRENMIFCLSAPYEHKNLEIIPKVAYYISQYTKTPPKFILTINHDSDLWEKILICAEELKISHYIETVGVLDFKGCVDFYRRSKIVFLPTLLEVFSATYLEAMAMRVPIVTSDLDFAHDNCKNAALYFQPGNPEGAAHKILDLLQNKELYYSLIARGKLVLKSYPDNESKYNMLFDWFKEIINRK